MYTPALKKERERKKIHQNKKLTYFIDYITILLDLVFFPYD